MEVAMFFREKRCGSYRYLQIVENTWDGGKTRQRVIGTLGRVEHLQDEGKLDALLESGARFSRNILVLNAHREGKLEELGKWRTGGPRVFERVWAETGCAAVIRELAGERKFKFDVERAVFTTVLHRLLDPGSDRACEKWKEGYEIVGANGLELQHFYRAMGWLGEPLEAQEEPAPFSPRCVKDEAEERLFRRRRDLFTTVDMLFFDTTSIYFEGEGGETLGEYGHSKDHRPDLKQMVVGALLDNDGRPVCSEIWPGNTADVKTLVPVARRMRERFGVEQACLVADRGMISRETIAWLEDQKAPWPYILGARMRRQKEVSEDVLSRAGRYREVHPERTNTKDPSPLKVKEVEVEGRRYVVCVNAEQARRDAAVREAILGSLEAQLKQGPKSLVGNKGYRRYLKAKGASFEIDQSKVEEEARYDGKWVLRTNTALATDAVALKYKQLWTVEDLFRRVKSVLSTRPVYHKCDETIRGHVFCSFLALVLMEELQRRIAAKGDVLEWADVVRDLDNLEDVELVQDAKRFRVRVGLSGCCGKVFQAAGVAIPPMVRQLS